MNIFNILKAKNMNEKKQFLLIWQLKGKNVNKQKGESVAEELRYGKNIKLLTSIKNSNH